MGPTRIHPLFNQLSSQQRSLNQASNRQSQILSQQSGSDTEGTIPDVSTSASKPKQRNSTTTSPIWDHGTRKDGPMGKMWRCNYCSIEYSASTTSNATRHLNTMHPTKFTSTGIRSINQTTIEMSIKPQIQAKILKKLLIEWIMDHYHAFKEIEAESLCNIMEYLDRAAISKLPYNANTIRND